MSLLNEKIHTFFKLSIIFYLIIITTIFSSTYTTSNLYCSLTSHATTANMTRYKYGAEGRIPLYRSNPSPTSFDSRVKKLFTYVPRQLYRCVKVHFRKHRDSLKGEKICEYRAKEKAGTNQAMDKVRNSSESSTVVNGSIYSYDGSTWTTPRGSDDSDTIAGEDTYWTQDQLARDFADHATAHLPHRLAEDFFDRTVDDLDEYVQMCELGTLEEALWERKESRRNQERNQFWNDTGMGSRVYL